mgnify:CR=1 FL=1|tara:strand:+ start:179 stop:697 length:519 start_codon:yes stop_codon:yes gene_type:complete
MAKRTYRTANGKQVDMDTLALKNETVIAVGNMNVNARGDVLGAGGKIVKSREEVMKDHYSVSNSIIPTDAPMPTADNDTTIQEPVVQAEQPVQQTPVEEKQIDDDPAGPLDTPVEEDQWVEDAEGNFVRPEDLNKQSTKGIADALADTKSISVPKEQTPKQKARTKSGIKRI